MPHYEVLFARSRRSGRLAIAGLLIASCLAGCAGSDTVSGRIDITPKLARTLRASDTLYVIATRPNAPGAPPVAVARMVGMRFPVNYTIDREDAIRPGSPLDGPLQIRAVIKRSGMVDVAVPGDMSGAYAHGPVNVGTSHVDFTINHLN